MSGITQEMHDRLQVLEPSLLEIEDQSESHRGHGGWKEGGETHFHITLSSPRLSGLSRIERQRLVHKALGDLTQRIHAMSMSLSDK